MSTGLTWSRTAGPPRPPTRGGYSRGRSARGRAPRRRWARRRASGACAAPPRGPRPGKGTGSAGRRRARERGLHLDRRGGQILRRLVGHEHRDLVHELLEVARPRVPVTQDRELVLDQGMIEHGEAGELGVRHGGGSYVARRYDATLRPRKALHDATFHEMARPSCNMASWRYGTPIA